MSQKLALLPSRECPSTGKALPYTGDPVPTWCRPGAKCRVKTTPETRFSSGRGSGLPCFGGAKSDDVVWAKEEGVVELVERPHPTQAEIDAGFRWYGGAMPTAGEGGWYDICIAFPRGRRLRLHGLDWELLAPVREA